jgi:hypothetical protein
MAVHWMMNHRQQSIFEPHWFGYAGKMSRPNETVGGIQLTINFISEGLDKQLREPLPTNRSSGGKHRFPRAFQVEKADLLGAVQSWPARSRRFSCDRLKPASSLTEDF